MSSSVSLRRLGWSVPRVFDEEEGGGTEVAPPVCVGRGG